MRHRWDGFAIDRWWPLAAGREEQGMVRILTDRRGAWPRAGRAGVLMGVTAVALSACGGGDSSGPASVAAPASSVSTSTFSSASTGASSSGSSAASSSTVTVTKQVPAPSKAASRRPGVPASAYPGAGGPRPAGAKELRESIPDAYSITYGFRLKSGKLGCLADPRSGRITCRNDNIHVGDENVGGMATVAFEHGVVTKGFADDAPLYGNPGTFVLPYGESRYRGDVVFVSDAKGLTVWDTSTGHGVFMNNQETTTF